VSTDRLKRTFLGYNISALRGCCALKFLHALQIDQVLLTHIGTGRGIPPKNFNRENLKFGLKFSVLGSITSGLLGLKVRTKSFLMKLFSIDVPRGRSDKVGTIFGRPVPKNVGGPKNRPKFCAISDNFRL